MLSSVESTAVLGIILWRTNECQGTKIYDAIILAPPVISTLQLRQQCTLTPQPRQVGFPLQCNVSHRRSNSFGKYRWPVVCRTLSRYIAFFVKNKRSPCILPAPHPYSWDCTVKLKNAKQIRKHPDRLQNRSYRCEKNNNNKTNTSITMKQKTKPQYHKQLY